MTNSKTEKPKETSGATKKKPPIVLVIIIIAALSAVGSFIIVKKSSAKSNKPEKKAIERGPILALDEFLVNLADPGGDHFLKVTMGLELAKDKGKTAESMKESIPPIRDAILYCLNSKQRSDVEDNAGQEKLKKEIVNKVNQTLGEDDVKSVYFTNFITQ